MGSNLKVGFFGGTFDPMHFGHLNLIVELKEKCHLDRILICPTHLSPTKIHQPSTAASFQRLKMVQLATQDIPWIEVTDIEIKRPPPSYTVDTLDLLVKKGEKNIQFYLIMAEDTAYTINTWKEPERLLELATPLVGTRYGFETCRLKEFSPFIRARLETGWIQISAMDISSTRLRARLKNHQYCGHLTPAKVLDYIYENHLYYTS